MKIKERNQRVNLCDRRGESARQSVRQKGGIRAAGTLLSRLRFFIPFCIGKKLFSIYVFPSFDLLNANKSVAWDQLSYF